ncbi:hypothetical protein ABW21_db0208559 [Orbilia brochopaga]|nr:hypothetical protein ABW21_db0208559 [Drechslerella brochopaga]
MARTKENAPENISPEDVLDKVSELVDRCESPGLEDTAESPEYSIDEGVFKQLVAEIALEQPYLRDKFKGSLKFTPTALSALQEATEEIMRRYFSMYAGRDTLELEDCLLWREILHTFHPELGLVRDVDDETTMEQPCGNGDSGSAAPQETPVREAIMTDL